MPQTKVLFSRDCPLNQLLKAKENKLYHSSWAETHAWVIQPYFALILVTIYSFLTDSPVTPTSRHLLFYLICSSILISFSLQLVMWLTEDLGILEEVQFIRGATVFYLNSSLFTNIQSTLATRTLINSKGNKPPLYLHWTDTFLGIMRQTLAGATLQIICKSPMDIYYSSTINYMCLENRY